jgi:hypothetical protein
MRFVLYDVRDPTRRVLVESEKWRATLAVLHQSSVLTKEQANRLVWLLGGPGTSIGESETKLIADYLTIYLLPQLEPEDSVTAQPDDFEFEEVTDGTMTGWGRSGRRAVRLSREWLASLAQLCAGSTRLAAISESATARWPQRNQSTTRGSRWRCRRTRGIWTPRVKR